MTAARIPPAAWGSAFVGFSMPAGSATCHRYSPHHNNPLPSMEHCVADWPADAVWQSVLDVESWIGRCSSARRSMVYSMPRRGSLHSRGTGRAAQERPRGAGQPAGLTFILVEDSQILVHALDVVGATVPEHDHTGTSYECNSAHNISRNLFDCHLAYAWPCYTKPILQSWTAAELA